MGEREAAHTHTYTRKQEGNKQIKQNTKRKTSTEQSSFLSDKEFSSIYIYTHTL